MLEPHRQSRALSLEETSYSDEAASKEVTIYYDTARHVVTKPYTRENLHLAAKLLGIKRCWFHARPYAHYDLPKRLSGQSPMELALEVDGNLLNLEDGGLELDKLGALHIELVSSRKILEIIKESA
jgi:hypothetical protein